MAYGYVTERQNLARSLAASAFTVSPGPNDSTRARLNDKRMDKLFSCTASTPGVTIVVDLGSAQAVDTVAILNHNLASFSSAQSIIVQAADNAAITVGVVTCGTITLSATATRPKDSCMSFASTTKRYWQFEFDWASGSNVLTIGELVLGVATTLSRGEIDGSGESDRISAPQVKLANGGLSAITLTGPVLERRLVFDDFSPTEMLFLRTLRRAAAGSVPLLWCDDWTAAALPAAPTESQQRCLWGNVTEPDYDETYTNYRLSRPNVLTLLSQGREVGA